MSISLGLYHRLPPSSRTLVASLRGYYLNWWRYDKRSAALVDEALERDHWTDDRWKSWQADRLAFILNRAATQVPYYRKMWAERRRQGDDASWAELSNWPILEKSILQANGKDLIADDCRSSKMFRDHTSGTTGTPLNVWLSRETVKQWYALHAARAQHWYGLKRSDRWAILGGQLITPVNQTTPPFWVWNRGMNQLYMSSYHLSPTLTGFYLEALAKYSIKYILGYPSAIYALAQSMLRKGVDGMQLRTVIANAEPLLDYQREVIERAFQCPIRETYGMAEIASAASECDHGSLHTWPDAGIIEAKRDAVSDLICTGLINSDMPLIRYRVGDRGRLSDEKCTCGRNLPLLASLDGRSDNILHTRDGRSIGRLDPVFKGGLAIREAQIIQRSLDTILVKFVKDDGFSDAVLTLIADRVRERMGDVSVVFEEEPNQIARTSNGKFRSVICDLPAEERLKLGSQINQ